MLRKMLIQGLAGAALIAAAAAIYSQVQAQDKPQDNGYLAAPGGIKDSDRDGGRERHDMHTGRHRERHTDRERHHGQDRDRN